MYNEAVRALLREEPDPLMRSAISALWLIHESNNGDRFDRDQNGLVLLDKQCYGRNQLKHIDPTTRASAHFLLAEIGITVDIDLENLPPCDGRNR